MELSGKTALVTGAGSGIGRASAIALARAGAKVLAADIRADGIEKTVALIRANGGTAEATIVDVTSASSVGDMIETCVKTFGSLDIAHNNAGLNNAAGDFASVDPREAEKLMAVNFWGVFHCLQAEIRQMLSQGGGSIVNTASGAGIVATPGTTLYCASKHAVIGLTKSVAAEYANRGIRVNSVCPGLVETPLVAEYTSNEELRGPMLAMHPIGRFAKPEEVAEAVLWLASPKASYAVGTNLLVDGGYTLA